MSDSKIHVRLSKEQRDFILSNVRFHQFHKIVKSARLVSLERYKLTLIVDEADRLRDIAGDMLQEIGFDADYKPTKEGVLLEELMDLLFVRRNDTTGEFKK